jgi:hypothetical protein
MYVLKGDEVKMEEVDVVSSEKVETALANRNKQDCIGLFCKGETTW